ncbi:PREDICTED: aldehyde dehydrogenase family 3 member B1-like, partial [Nestor notabilis]|uniref:aldehyde dehydrogenase family 3 member B1-like n=1 Tax=Nestor notabilis TaxID=176057 RepID=UPI000523C59F
MAPCPQPPFEAELTEILLCKNELHETLNNLCHWMKDKHVERNMATRLDSAFIRKDPYGVVLVMGPWCCPINLLLGPLIGAIAAGNCVVIKPSEMTKNVEKLMAKALPSYLDRDCFAVVTAGVQETTRLLENKFDYIFFTGMSHGPEQSPAWVCPLEVQEKLLPALQKVITEFYGSNPRESPDFGRIVDEKEFQRLQMLLRSGRVAIGGQMDEKDLYIAPTVLVDVQPSDPIMQDTILGPILPIVNVANMDEAIDFINSRERPLAVYVFSSDDK